MRLWILLIVLLTIMAVFVTAERRLYIGGVDYELYTPPGNIPFTVQVEKYDSEDKRLAEDVRAQIFIPELGIKGSSRFIEGLGRSPKRLYALTEVPQETPMGEYWVRIQVSNEANGGKRSQRVIHRPITITERRVPESRVRYCPKGHKFCAS